MAVGQFVTNALLDGRILGIQQGALIVLTSIPQSVLIMLMLWRHTGISKSNEKRTQILLPSAQFTH